MKRHRENREPDKSDEQDLLEFEYNIIDNLYIKPLFRVAFAGDFPYGSSGHGHAIFMQMKTNEAIRIVTSQYHRLPQGIIYDLTNLLYEWGDWMATVFLPYPTLQTKVAVEKTKDALSTLPDSFGTSFWAVPLFETVAGGIKHIEAEMLRTFITKCPTCTEQFIGKRFTTSSCPKCGSRLTIDLVGTASIGEESPEKRALEIINHFQRFYKNVR